MDKLTEFVTNSFVDREVSVLMSKCIAKSEPVSPSSSISADDLDDRHISPPPPPLLRPHGKKVKRDVQESQHNHNNNNNNNNEDEPRRKIPSDKGNMFPSAMCVLINFNDFIGTS